MDRNSIEIQLVTLDKEILKFVPFIHLDVYDGEPLGFLKHCVEDKELDIFASNDDLNKLLEDVEDNIRLIWNEIVLKSDDELSESSKALKQVYLSRVKLLDEHLKEIS